MVVLSHDYIETYYVINQVNSFSFEVFDLTTSSVHRQLRDDDDDDRHDYEGGLVLHHTTLLQDLRQRHTPLLNAIKLIP